MNSPLRPIELRVLVVDRLSDAETTPYRPQKCASPPQNLEKNPRKEPVGLAVRESSGNAVAMLNIAIQANVGRFGLAAGDMAGRRVWLGGSLRSRTPPSRTPKYHLPVLVGRYGGPREGLWRRSVTREAPRNGGYIVEWVRVV